MIDSLVADTLNSDSLELIYKHNLLNRNQLQLYHLDTPTDTTNYFLSISGSNQLSDGLIKIEDLISWLTNSLGNENFLRLVYPAISDTIYLRLFPTQYPRDWIEPYSIEDIFAEMIVERDSVRHFQFTYPDDSDTVNSAHYRFGGWARDTSAVLMIANDTIPIFSSGSFVGLFDLEAGWNSFQVSYSTDTCKIDSTFNLFHPPQFLDLQTITDANGSKFLFKPLTTVNGATAKFDLVNDYAGLSSIPYAGRGAYYNLGNNTGLVHSFVDSNNVVNGQIYYYAVVSYDHGDDSLGVAPTECSKSITLNPETNEIFLDVNTIRIIPRIPTAGFSEGVVLDDGFIDHVAGFGTGIIKIDIIDPRALEDNNNFELTFNELPTRYSIEDQKITIESNTVSHNVHFPLSNRNINSDSFYLLNSTGDTMITGIDYLFFPDIGQIVVPDSLPTSLSVGEAYTVGYTYFPVYESRLLNSEESNPVFDGMKLFIHDDPLDIDNSRTDWEQGSQTNYRAAVGPFNWMGIIYKFDADFEIRFSNSIIDTGLGGITANFEIFNVTNGTIPAKQEFAIIESLPTDGTWSPGDKVVAMVPDAAGVFDFPQGKFKALGEFTFVAPIDVIGIAPVAGDIFFIGTIRPFTSEDVYQFSTQASNVNPEQAKNDLDRIRVIPNPYVVTNQLEQLNLQNPRDRGPRRIYFDRLPAQCTIKIYTITGELVDVLEHNSTIDDGKEYWDLTTRDNFPIAYGMYLYHVDAGSFGEKIGRFAVIK